MFASLDEFYAPEGGQRGGEIKCPFDVTRNSGFSTYTTVFLQSTGCCRTAPLKKQPKSSGFSLGSPPKTPLFATPLEILHSVNKTGVWPNILPGLINTILQSVSHFTSMGGGWRCVWSGPWTFARERNYGRTEIRK